MLTDNKHASLLSAFALTARSGLVDGPSVPPGVRGWQTLNGVLSHDDDCVEMLGLVFVLYNLYVQRQFLITEQTYNSRENKSARV